MHEAEVAAVKVEYGKYTITALGTEFKPNSKAKIARDAIDDFGLDKYGHTNQKWISDNYVKEPFDKYAETDSHYVWVNYNTYKPMPAEDLHLWQTIPCEGQISEEQRANTFDRMMQGEDISKKKGCYKKAIGRFKDECNYIPVHVRNWKMRRKE